MSRFGVFVFRAACILGACVAASAVLAAPPSIQPGSWTLAVLPDTQHYAESYPDIFNEQTQFIADYKTSLNIAYVLHEGDLTDDNNSTQWGRASTAFDILDNASVPYSLLPGNHDYGTNGTCNNRTSYMADYFPVMRLAGRATFGSVYPGEPDSPHNSYSLFGAGGTDWLVLAMEFAPRDQIVDWADGVLKQHPNRQAMIVTHAYLYYGDVLYDYATYGEQGSCSPYSYPIKDEPGGVNDGGDMWTKLKDNPNLQFIFSGHSGETGYRADEADHGNVVHQILANYQDLPEGGEGYLRLLEFLPDGRTVHVRTYSPHLDCCRYDSVYGEGLNDFMLTMTQVPEPSSLRLAAVAGLGCVSVLAYKRWRVFRCRKVLRRRTCPPCDCGN